MRSAAMTHVAGVPQRFRPRRASLLSALLLLLLGAAAADAQVSASNIDFGVVTDIEFPKDRILTLTNSGPSTVTVSAATVPPGSPFRVQSGLPVTIAPGASSPIVVRFSDPGIQQQFTDTMRFTVAPTGSPVTALLRGKKVFRTSIEGPALVEMSLGICDPGPKDTTVLLTNPGVNTLVVTNITLSNDSNFTVTPPLSFPFSIPAGGAVAVGLRFNPKSAGRKYATLNVSSTAVNAPLLKVPLEGIKDAAVLVALSIYYGSLTPDLFPATRLLTIRNAGTVEITVDSLTFGAFPPFAVIGGLPLVLQPSQSADLTVRFDDPGSDGYYSDTLTIHHSPMCQILKVLVAGTRISAPKIAGPSTLRFSDRLCTLAPKDSAVVISNTGAYTLSISAITLGGSPDFSVPTRLPRDIPTGMSDTISVRFTPSGWGFKSTAMTLWSNAVNEPQFVVQVFATADRPGLTTAPIAFGSVIPADFPVSRSVWLVNTGHAEIRLDAATFNIPLPYTFASALPLTVQPGDSVQVQVVFEDPGTDGTFARRMSLQYTPTCGATEIPIFGERFSRPIIAGPDSIRFATQRCPDAFRDSLIVVRNTGGGELLVTGVQVSGDASFSLASAVPLPARIAPRGELAVLVRFFPLSTGEKSGVLLFVSNSSVTSALSIPLRGAKDSLGLTALPVDFGTLQPTQLPATLAVRISNHGSVDAVVVDARFTGATPFSHAATVPFMIPAGGSRLVDVTFGDPGADGAYRDTSA
ncbi:MAG: choice-of-anchor D domain-containing protein [Ignavibacteria bacterium]|nr:choice-of-anchor D domain-containing protein [Ignavibacteria bacterium]